MNKLNRFKIDSEYLRKIREANGYKWFEISDDIGINQESLHAYLRQGYTANKTVADKINNYIESYRLVICHKKEEVAK